MKIYKVLFVIIWFHQVFKLYLFLCLLEYFLNQKDDFFLYFSCKVNDCTHKVD